MTQWSHNAVPDILASHRDWEQLLTVVFQCNTMRHNIRSQKWTLRWCVVTVGTWSGAHRFFTTNTDIEIEKDMDIDTDTNTDIDRDMCTYTYSPTHTYTYTCTYTSKSVYRNTETPTGTIHMRFFCCSIFSYGRAWKRTPEM